MKYSNFLRDVFEKHTSNLSVIEFGASTGVHSELVNEYADSLFTVDPHIRYDVGGDITPDFYGTANDYYKQETLPEFDVVLCMGLLYHLHCPFHLLEQIINISKPKVLIVESLRKEEIGASMEIDWAMSGNAHADIGIEYPLQINAGPKGADVIKAIETTPMKLDKFYEYSKKREEFSEMVPIGGYGGYENMDDWFVQTYAGGVDMSAKKDFWLAVFTK